MLFALGFIAGVAVCVFMATVLTYFKKPLVSTLTKTEAAIIMAGPGGRGFVMEPDSDAQIARQEHIQRNAEAGKDTRISELL